VIRQRALLALTLGVMLPWGASDARADLITLFNTGVTTDNTTLAAAGTADLHYTLISEPAGTMGTTATIGNPTSLPSGWTASTSTSQWISPTTNLGTIQPTGTFDYRTTFSLGPEYANTAIITGKVAAHDDVTILLNGNTTGITFTNASSLLNSFTITSGFKGGTNTLDFVVDNRGGATGLQTQLSGTVDIAPEPSTFAVMLGCGLGMIVYGRLRRRP
jgi:hypothetical protein